MAENLKYLPKVTNAEQGSESEPYYYVYEYEGTDVNAAKATQNYQAYGVLYNWTAAMAGAESSNSNPSGVKGICPEGWHLPSVAEWDALGNYLGDNVGGKLKHKDYWSSPNEGATNETSFSALPAGRRDHSGYFSSINYSGYWWCSTKTSIYAKVRAMYYYRDVLDDSYNNKGAGFSIRCIKDKHTGPPPNTYTVLVATLPSSGGTTTGGGNFSPGNHVSITATAASGYEFINWSGDIEVLSNPQSATVSFNMPSRDIRLTANFKKIVDPGEGDSFTDSRDGNRYKTVKIGNQVWMAENLKYLPKVAGAEQGSDSEPHYYVYGYEGTDVSAAKATQNYETYGVLYNWPAAVNNAKSSDTNPSGVRGVCPQGWHLPSHAEWNELVDYLGGSAIAGGKLKHTDYWLSPNIGATNESGFSGLPGGIYYFTSFYLLEKNGYWWSSTENEQGRPYNWHLSNDDTALTSYDGYLKDPGLSVRCIRD